VRKRRLERNYRKPFEFTKQTKTEALRRAGFSCESCGVSKRETKEKYFEIHHQIAIGWYLKNKEQFYFVSHAFISSLENAMCLCVDCHTDLHRNESLDYYLGVAQAIAETTPQLALPFMKALSKK